MKAPLKDHLVGPDEATLQRSWRAIDERMTRAPRRRLWMLAPAGLAVATVIAVLVLRSTPAPGPLAIAGGGPVPFALTGTTAFADGSSVSGDLALVENTAHTMHLALARGTARFSITPGGSRAWTIDAGLAEVRVIGTVFTVARSATTVDVAVERGIVEVRSADGVKRLHAGEQLRVGTLAAHSAQQDSHAASSTDTSHVADAERAEASRLADAERAEATRTERAAAPGVDERADVSRVSGRAAVPVDAATRPAQPRVADVVTAQALLDAADAQRLAGDLDGAIGTLARVATAPRDSNVAIAWFTRARLLAQLGRRAEAALDFQRAIDAKLPPALEQASRARLRELAP